MTARTWILALVALLLASPAEGAGPLSGLGAAGDTKLVWNGRRTAVDAPEVPYEASRAAAAWAPFADEHGYTLTLVGDGRLLLVSDGGRSTTERQIELIGRTLEQFEGELPAPPPSTGRSGADADAGGAAEDVIPEDPEGPPPGWEPPQVEGAIESYEYGVGTIAPDTQTIVLLVLKNEKHYRAALEVLAGLAEYLREWTREAGRNLGFVLEVPLCGAYVLNASGQEEWNPDNELINRVAQLCLLRRFGQQPHWLVQGYAWHMEFKLQGAVYAFPYRDEFVWATEHTDWDKEVARRFADDPPDFRELTGWDRGTYDASASRVAWALVDWTLRAHPRKLPLVLDDLRRFRDEDNRTATSETTWERDRDYEVPGSKQRAMFQERLGKSFLRELAKAYD